MPAYYLDTSALAKRYIVEVGSAWVQAIVAGQSGQMIYKQIPRSSRRNSLPMECINRLLLMRHKHLTCALGELIQSGQTPSGAARILHHPPEAFDVIVATHKTIDLVFHTQVYKLKRDMTRNNAVSASAIAFMQNEVMEVNDETLVHSPATDGGRPAPGGAPPQGPHDHSRTPGGQ